MKIGEVARRVGIPIDTVRYYERNGLLPPPARRASGYRDYHDSDIARLNFVLRAKALGFTLVEIRELLQLSDAAEGDMANIRGLAASKLQDIEQRIAHLARVRDALKGLVDACPGRGHVSGCPIRSTLFDLQEPVR